MPTEFGDKTGAITFDFSKLERSMSRSLRFGRLISHKDAELGHVLLLDTTHIESPIAPSHLILGDLVRSKSRSLGFLMAYIYRKRVKIGDMLLASQEIIYGESNSMIAFDCSDLARSIARCV